MSEWEHQGRKYSTTCNFTTRVHSVIHTFKTDNTENGWGKKYRNLDIITAKY